MLNTGEIPACSQLYSLYLKENPKKLKLNMLMLDESYKVNLLSLNQSQKGESNFLMLDQR